MDQPINGNHLFQYHIPEARINRPSHKNWIKNIEIFPGASYAQKVRNLDEMNERERVLDENSNKCCHAVWTGVLPGQKNTRQRKDHFSLMAEFE